MTPEEFATALRKVADTRETSWDEAESRYTKTWDEAASEVVQEPWARIVSVLLFPGYCDVWDWCDSVLGPVAA